MHKVVSQQLVPDLARLLVPARSDLTVVITVHNGGDAARHGISAIVRNTPPNVQVIVIDDASTDPVVVADLDQLAGANAIKLIRHHENQGYTRSANEGLLASTGDVVLVNSDAVPGPRWLERLRAVAYSQARVATVSACSDWAGSVSVPVPHQKNDWPEQYGWDAVSRAVAHGQSVLAIPMIVGHGFCMYIRRDAIEAVGLFDADSFPRGYGEEVDFSLRARSAGLGNLLAASAIVKHYKSASFGPSVRQELNLASKKILESRYPSLSEDMRRWERSPEWTLTKSSAARVLSRPSLPFAAPRRVRVECSDCSSSSRGVTGLRRYVLSDSASPGPESLYREVGVPYSDSDLGTNSRALSSLMVNVLRHSPHKVELTCNKDHRSALEEALTSLLPWDDVEETH